MLTGIENRYWTVASTGRTTRCGRSLTAAARWRAATDDGVPHESLNHYSKGAVIGFLHRYTAGIRPGDDPGCRTFRVEPVPGGGLTSAAAHESPYGLIASSWTLDGGTLHLDVSVPPGTCAEIRLPDGRVMQVDPGDHHFTSTVPVPLARGEAR